MAELRVVKGVMFFFEAPEMAAHVAENLKVCILGKLELLLKVNGLLVRVNLEQFCLGDLDHYLVAVGSRHCEVLLEHLNQILHFPRQ